MIKYKVKGEYLDQFDGKRDFAITKAISKIGEINLRHGDRSTSFKVPLTANNTRILNYVTDLGSSTTNESFQRLEGKIIENETVISDGYFQVTKFDPYKKEVSMRFYGGNTDWFSLLKDRNINENISSYSVSDLLDFSLLPIDIKNSFTTTLGVDGSHKFFLTDNNKDSKRNSGNVTQLDTTLEDYQIGFSQGVIFDKIFESVDVKLNGNMFDDPFYYNTLISSSKNIRSLVDSVLNKRFTISEGYPSQSLPYNQSSYDYLTFDSGDTLQGYDNGRFTFQGGATGLELDINIQASALVGLGAVELYVELSLNGVQQTVITVPLDTNLSTGGVYVFSQNIDYFYLTQFVKGDYVDVKFSTSLPPTAGGTPTEFRYVGETNLETFGAPFLKMSIYDYNASSEFNLLIPNIKQSEFVKDVLVQFGAITQYDVKTKTLTCNKFSIIDDNRHKAPDLSKKVDVKKAPQIELTKLLSKYGKKSFFKYSEYEESDIYNTLYNNKTNYQLGTGALQINNGFLEDEKDFYESPYAPTITIETFPSSDPGEAGYQLGNLYLPFVPTFTLTGADDVGNPVYDDNDLEPRKYLYSGNIDISTAYKGNVTSIDIDYDGFTENTTILPLIYFSKNQYSFEGSDINNVYDTLDFSFLSEFTTNSYGYGFGSVENSLLNKYYKFQKKILDKPISLEIYLTLNSLDIQSIDFFTPIWLSFGLDSGYYYIDEISQYKGENESTKVKLVKI